MILENLIILIINQIPKNWNNVNKLIFSKTTFIFKNKKYIFCIKIYNLINYLFEILKASFN